MTTTVTSEKVTRVVPGAIHTSTRLSRIPSEVAEHFEAIGSVLSVAYADQRAVAQYQVSGRVPVFRDEMTDECHKALLRAGWREERTDGTYRIGDCLLYVQPESQRDAYREEKRMEWLRLDDEDHWRDEIEGLNQSLKSQVSSTVGASLFPTHLSSASAHVRRGPITGDES